MSTRGFKISIFLPGGDLEGLQVVEKSNWTGRGVVCPRALFARARSRSEFDKTGVYVLLAPPTESGLPRVYVGEGDPVRPRLDQHIIKKDFWTVLILFTSKDDNLNKAHVQHLEARLVEIAERAKRCELENQNVPSVPSLSEAEQAEVEGFLDEMQRCFPVLGVHVFEQPSPAATTTTTLFLRSKGIEAKGHELSQGFVVRAGSTGVAEEVPSIHRYLSELRRTLQERGILQRETGHLVLTQDYVFDSPSSAAGVMLGRSANGRVEWMDARGQTLKHLQGISDST